MSLPVRVVPASDLDPSGHRLPVDVTTGPGAELVHALAAALAGSGPAVLPVPRDPHPSDGLDLSAPVPDGTALVLRTSGSTGTPRAVLLSAAALTASATATAQRLGGPGQWLLALPAVHVAGVQVVVRSILAGTEPVALRPGPFRLDAFVEATARLDPGRRYTALVPTQLHRLMGDPAGVAALRHFDAVLLGGAAAAPTLVAAARDAGVRVVTTYGMTETCGGCVYDGVPLDGVEVALDDGRIELSGPVLATGYLARPELDEQAFLVRDGRRWLRTSDLGAVDRDSHGRTHLRVLGRADDVLVTGGAKVAPLAVEQILTGLDEVAEACVVGLPDAEWGQAVTAVLVLRPGADVPATDRVRALVAQHLGAPAAPRHLVVTDALPQRGPGKTDRRAAVALAARLLGSAGLGPDG